MKPFFRAIFLVVIFLTFNGLFFWRNDIGNFLQAHPPKFSFDKFWRASISRFLPQPENEITGTEDEIEPVFEQEIITENQNSTTSLNTTGASAPVFSFAMAQEQIDDISEKVDVLNQKVGELVKENPEEQELPEEETKKPETEEKKKEEEEKEEEIEVGQEVGQSFCDINSGTLPFQSSIVINEIAWMGSINSSNDEWFELKNASNQALDLAGWQILSQSDSIAFIFPQNAIFLAGGLWLLERGDDEAVPGILADFIYTGALKNSGETLYIFDNNCQLQDKVEALTGWPAGDNDFKRTMERRQEFALAGEPVHYGDNWQTSFSVGGTPKKETGGGYLVVLPPAAGGATGAGAAGAAAGPPAAGQEKPVYPKILISEVKISEKRGDKNVFVEIYNPTTSEVDLTDWYLQRKTASSSEPVSFVSKNLFAGKKIPGQSYFLLSRQGSDFASISEIIFDNTLTEDNTLILKNPNQEISDEASWQKIPEQNSWGRIYDEASQAYLDPFENQAPTPKDKNNRLPQAYFSFLPEKPEEKQEILFDACSSTDPDGTITSFLWDFGDNSSTTTNSATTTHIYDTSGQFLLTLWVTDDRGAKSLATSSIEIAKIPQAVLGISPTSFSFKGEQEENLGTQALIIENTGGSDLNWIISSDQDWLILSSTSGATPTLSSSTVEISINTLNLASGNYTAAAAIECEDCENSPQEILINLSLFPKTKKSVVINEIAWMGTTASANDEWIELYNNTDAPIEITGWILAADDNSPNITFSTSTIESQGYFLLERTSSTTISDIKEDQIYSGGLNNSGEKLQLKYDFGNLIDLVDCSSVWFAGDKNDKVSMERINPELSGTDSSNWANNNYNVAHNGLDAQGNAIHGTPKAKNSVSP